MFLACKWDIVPLTCRLLKSFIPINLIQESPSSNTQWVIKMRISTIVCAPQCRRKYVYYVNTEHHNMLTRFDIIMIINWVCGSALDLIVISIFSRIENCASLSKIRQHVTDFGHARRVSVGYQFISQMIIVSRTEYNNLNLCNAVQRNTILICHRIVRSFIIP